MRKTITFRVIGEDIVVRVRAPGALDAKWLRAIGLRVARRRGARYRLVIAESRHGEHYVRAPFALCRVYRRDNFDPNYDYGDYMVACYLPRQWSGKYVRLTLKRLR